MKKFAEVLEELVKEKQIKQIDLAAGAKLTAGYVNHLIKGTRSAPSPEVVAALADSMSLAGAERVRLFEAAGLPPEIIPDAPVSKRKIDWGEAPNVQVFYGREQELEDLERWVVQQRCQMICVLGMGGIGKTALTARLAEQMQDRFEFIIWRSLYNAPSVENILKDCLQVFSGQQRKDIAGTLDEQMAQLLGYLRHTRCLIVLDNFESVLQENRRVGQYRPEYQDYGRLLRLLGEARHQSCILLTSREKPQEIARSEGHTRPVRSMRLLGVRTLDGQAILEDSGLSGSEEVYANLISYYSGNPLALKLASEYIREVFFGDVARFLEKQEFVFAGILDLIEQQFQRLSPLERDIVYWLAINREAVSLANIQEHLVHSVPESALLVAIGSLRQRSMIESDKPESFYLQPVIMEYVTEKFVAQIYDELVTGMLALFESHALLIAQSKDYVRASQIRIILEPLKTLLISTYQKAGCEKRFSALLAQLRAAPLQHTGYAAGNILNLLIQLGSDPRGYDFSWLTVRQAYLLGANLPEVNFSHAHFVKSVFTHTFGSVFSLALSPDGAQLAVGTANSEISLWQTTSNVPLLTYRGHTDWIRSVAFSPDGRLLASASEDKTIRLWEAGSRRCLRVLTGHTNRVCSVVFSPDGKLLVSASNDQTLRVWEVSSGQCLQVLELDGRTNWVYAVRFSPDGKTFASASDDALVRVWDVSSRQCVQTLSGHSDKVYTVAFSPDGRTLASASEDQTIRLWDLASGRCLHLLPTQSSVRCIAFHPDGRLLASGDEDRQIHLWDAKEGKWLQDLSGHDNSVRAVVFSPDGKTLISGSEDQAVRLWELASGRWQCVRVLRGHTYWVYTVAFSPDGRTLASAGDDQAICLWDTDTGYQIKNLDGQSKIRTVAFSPAGHLLAAGSDDHAVRIWDIASGNLIRLLSKHTGWVRSVVFSPDGKTLASASEDRTIYIWNVDAWTNMQELRGHQDWVYSVAYSPDGKMLASASADQTLRLWDISSARTLHVFEGHNNRVCSVAYSPDGKTIASASADQTLRLWDIGTGQCIRVFAGHSDWIFSVAFSSDGKTLASGSDDRTVRLWNVASGECLCTLEGHKSWVYSVCFSPAGMVVASGSDDGTVRLWDTRSGNSFHTLRRDRPYERMNIAGARGLTPAQKDVLIALGAVED